MPGARRAVATPHRQELNAGQEDMVWPGAGQKDVLWTETGQETDVSPGGSDVDWSWPGDRWVAKRRWCGQELARHPESQIG